jgi:Zn-dependent peptidase ImmA (M78 family)
LPRPSVLLQIALALDIPADHLLGAADSADAAIEWLTYRKHSRLGAKRQQQLEAMAEQRAEAFVHLLRLLHPDEEPALPPARPAARLEDAEEAALDLRSRWGLGRRPIERLVPLVEDAGALVIESPVEDRFDALSGRTRRGLAVVVLNLDRPSDRLRFNLAHELGHLLLDCRKLEAREEEQLANRFAAAFLVPAEAARRELGSHRTRLSTAELEHLKRKYGFSMQAWTYRARELGIITEPVFRDWQVWFRSRGLRVRESAEYAGEERPQRLGVLCMQALTEHAVHPTWVDANFPELRGRFGAAPGARESLVGQLRRLSPEQRERILAASAERAAADCERDPEIREWLELSGPIPEGECGA